MKENSRLTMMLKGNCEAIASERKERILRELRETTIKKEVDADWEYMKLFKVM